MSFYYLGKIIIIITHVIHEGIYFVCFARIHAHGNQRIFVFFSCELRRGGWMPCSRLLFLYLPSVRLGFYTRLGIVSVTKQAVLFNFTHHFSGCRMINVSDQIYIAIL